MKGKYNRLIIELIAWSCFIVFPIILFPTLQPFMSKGVLNEPLLGIMITHGLLIIFYYFNFYFNIPRFYFTEKKKTFGLILVICFTVLVLIVTSNPDFNIFPSPPFRYAGLTFIFSIFLRFMVVMFVSLGLAHIQRLKEAEDQKIKTELSYLKAQVNPHFLFNTLNSLYALTVKKSDKAPEAVTRLSSIMRYVITEAANDTVPLEKELNYINSYIELERLRVTDKVNLKYEVSGDFAGVKIAPMILITLIENAFKHGVSTKVDTAIRIRIDFDGKELKLEVQNSKHRDSNGTGLGLENVKKRLNLLYPGKHDLNIEETENEFLIDLRIRPT